MPTEIRKTLHRMSFDVQPSAQMGRDGPVAIEIPATIAYLSKLSCKQKGYKQTVGQTILLRTVGARGKNEY